MFSNFVIEQSLHRSTMENWRRSKSIFRFNVS